MAAPVAKFRRVAAPPESTLGESGNAAALTSASNEAQGSRAPETGCGSATAKSRPFQAFFAVERAAVSDRAFGA